MLDIAGMPGEMRREKVNNNLLCVVVGDGRGNQERTGHTFTTCWSNWSILQFDLNSILFGGTRSAAGGSEID